MGYTFASCRLQADMYLHLLTCLFCSCCWRTKPWAQERLLAGCTCSYVSHWQAYYQASPICCLKPGVGLLMRSVEASYVKRVHSGTTQLCFPTASCGFEREMVSKILDAKYLAICNKWYPSFWSHDSHRIQKACCNNCELWLAICLSMYVCGD